MRNFSSHEGRGGVLTKIAICLAVLFGALWLGVVALRYMVDRRSIVDSYYKDLEDAGRGPVTVLPPSTTDIYERMSVSPIYFWTKFNFNPQEFPILRGSLRELSPEELLALDPWSLEYGARLRPPWWPDLLTNEGLRRHVGDFPFFIGTYSKVSRSSRNGVDHQGFRYYFVNPKTGIAYTCCGYSYPLGEPVIPRELQGEVTLGDFVHRHVSRERPYGRWVKFRFHPEDPPYWDIYLTELSLRELRALDLWGPRDGKEPTRPPWWPELLTHQGLRSHAGDFPFLIGRTHRYHRWGLYRHTIRYYLVDLRGGIGYYYYFGEDEAEEAPRKLWDILTSWWE